MLRNVRSRTSLLAPFAVVLALLAGLVTGPALTASADSSFPPHGILGQTISYDTESNIGSDEEEIDYLRTAFRHNESTLRYVKVTAVLRVQTTIGGTTANAYIDLLKTTLCNGTCPYVRIAGSNTYMAASGGAGSETMIVTGYAQIPNGVWNAIISVKRSVGAGSIAVSQTAGTPQTVLVEDIGRFAA